MSYGGPIFKTLGLNASTNSSYSGDFTSKVGAVTGCPGPQNSVLAANGNPGEQIFSNYNTSMKGGGAALAYNFDAENTHQLNTGVKGTYMPVSSGLVLAEDPINMGSSKQLLYGGKKHKKHKKGGKSKKSKSHSRSHKKRQTRKFKRGTKSVTRKCHKDFETHKSSRYYSRKLPGSHGKRHRLLAPVFPYLGGRKTKKGGNMNNIPYAHGYTLDTKVPSALANPTPISSYNHCQNNYNHFTGETGPAPEVVTNLTQ